MITTAIILLFILGCFALAFAVYTDVDIVKLTMLPLGGALLLASGLLLGEHKGAYKMLRDDYEVKYIINSNQEVTDTLITFY